MLQTLISKFFSSSFKVDMFVLLAVWANESLLSNLSFLTTVRGNIGQSLLQGCRGDWSDIRDVISLLHSLEQAETSQMNWFKIPVSSYSRFPNIDFVLQRYKFVCWTWNVFISTLVQMFIVQCFWARACLSKKQCVVIFCFIRDIQGTQCIIQWFSIGSQPVCCGTLGRGSRHTSVPRHTGWEPLL